jgi:glycosyltransferase involved in cell wall biosynthesis
VKLFFLSDLWKPFPGGAETFIFNVAEQLRQRGHSIHLLTSYWKAGMQRWMGEYQPAEPRTFEHGGMEISFVSIGVRAQGSQAHVEGWRLIESHLARVKPDALVTHHFFAREFADELAYCGIPVVQVVHNGARLPCARLAVYNSEYTRRRDASARASDLTILPPAFAVDVASAEHGAALGFVKPIQHKGINFIYSLAEHLPQRVFLILRGEWKTLEDIRPRPNIVFLDPVERVADFYRRCSVVLVPSLQEDAGTVPQEAAANGLPCISSDVGGLVETNAAGIRLPLECALWAHELHQLDREPYYSAVAARQTSYFKAYDWPRRFDELDREIRRCVSA